MANINAPSGSTMSILLQGLQREFQSINNNAARVARWGTTKTPEENLFEPILDFKQDLNQVKAITTVIKVNQEIEDEVLNIIA